jgi:hypothetical protein
MTEFVSATADIRGDYRYQLTRVRDLALPGHVPPSGVISLLRVGQWFQLRRQ